MLDDYVQYHAIVNLCLPIFEIQNTQDHTGEDAEDSLRVLRHAVRSRDCGRPLEHNPPKDLAKVQA